MKTITLNVSEPIYYRLRKLAQKKDRTASELIREIMERYVESSGEAQQDSVLDFKPASCGSVLKPLSAEDDLLEEMLNG